MNDKKKNTAKNKAEHTIRCNEVIATITLRQSNAGFTYLDYSLGRVWRSQTTGKESHGSSFFEKNERDLIAAITEASTWIRAKLASGPPDQKPESDPDPET